MLGSSPCGLSMEMLKEGSAQWLASLRESNQREWGKIAMPFMHVTHGFLHGGGALYGHENQDMRINDGHLGG